MQKYITVEVIHFENFFYLLLTQIFCYILPVFFGCVSLFQNFILISIEISSLAKTTFKL